MRIKKLSIATKMTLSIVSLQLITLYLTIAYFMYDAKLTNKQAFEGGIPDPQAQLILAAATYDNENKLVISPSDAVSALLRNPDIWVVLSDSKGQLVKFGHIPVMYDSLILNMNSLGMSEVKVQQEYRELAMKLLTKKIADRTVHVMVGGIPLYKTRDIFAFIATVLSLHIFMPMGIVIVVLIPFITRKILSGLSSAANDARNINESDRKARIREVGIPREVMPLVKAVNDALQRLSDGYDARDRFLSSAAHELRAPIAIIEARLRIIADTEARNILANDVARMANLAESLLDLQRIGHGLSHFAPLDLKKMLRQVVSDYSPIIISAGYGIELLTCNDPVYVSADAAALSRAIINILQNSVNYGEGKGVITVALDKEGVICIQDEGPGIDPAERERIFEPFHRLIPRAEGSGLGLHLVKEIVLLHKGSVMAGESARGGALFVIQLPLLHGDK